MSEFADLVLRVSVFVFVVSSMLSMGLSLTLKQITAPLSNKTLVAKSLLANFVLVPMLAYLIIGLLDLDMAIQTSLLLLATAAGAPFLPKLVQISKGDVKYGVGLMVLLVVVTIFYLPLVLPWMMPEVTIDSKKIAMSLIMQMLVPLGIGLYVKHYSKQITQTTMPIMAKTANISLIFLLVFMIAVNYKLLLSAFGTGAFVAGILFVFGSFGVGYVLGGPKYQQKKTLAFGTAQRNIAAAFIVMVASFKDDSIFVSTMTIAVLIVAISMLLAKFYGVRAVGAKTRSKTSKKSNSSTSKESTKSKQSSKKKK